MLELTKCQDLENEVARLNGQLEDARKISELDQETIAQLREVIGKKVQNKLSDELKSLLNYQY